MPKLEIGQSVYVEVYETLFKCVDIVKEYYILENTNNTQHKKFATAKIEDFDDMIKEIKVKH